MLCNACRQRYTPGQCGLFPDAANTIITNRMDCGSAQAESTAEELYSEVAPEILVNDCYDHRCGRSLFDVRRRCKFWPSFAHPRWLTCNELYSNGADEDNFPRPARGLNGGCGRLL